MKFLNNKFRQLCLLKHRDGKDNITSPLLFNGEINYFKELPLPNDPELQKVYNQLNKF